MAMRVRPAPNGSWQAEVGSSPALVRRDGFPDRGAAEAWAMTAEGAIRASTVRIGSKRFLGTPAEALCRWAIDHGTLLQDEGGSGIAPRTRLAPLAADPICAIPLAALVPDDLVLLRRHRLAALGCAATLLVEQAALAAAIETFCEFFLPALGTPFAEGAADGICLLDAATMARVAAEAERLPPALGLALRLVLATGIAPEELAAARLVEVPAPALALPGRTLPLNAVLARRLPPRAQVGGALLPPSLPPAEIAEAVAALGRRLGRPGLTVEALRGSAFAAQLRAGAHLDEVLGLAGAEGTAPEEARSASALVHA